MAKNSSNRYRFAAVLAAFLISVASLTHARSTIDGGESDRAIRANLQPTADKRLISREEATKRAVASNGGRVISVQLVETDQNAAPYYRIKLLIDGNVQIVNIMASR